RSGRCGPPGAVRQRGKTRSTRSLSARSCQCPLTCFPRKLKAGARMYFTMAWKIMEMRAWAQIVTALVASCVIAGPQPDDPKQVFERGQHALAVGKYAEAERDFDHLLGAGVRSAPVYTNLGVVYLRIGKFDKAIQVLKEAKKLAPEMTGIDPNLGLAYYKKREFAQAALYFAAVLSADSANIQAHYLEGVCHFMMDQFDAAASAFGPIENREQDDLAYLFMLGISYGN